VLAQVFYRRPMIGLSRVTPEGGCCLRPGAWLPRALLLWLG
jgi:hypothetical protein